MPSRPVAVLTATAVNVLYALVPAGRARATAASGRGRAGRPSSCAGRLYLAVDHPTDIAGRRRPRRGVPLAGWRLLVPNDVFPVTYRRGRTAHLDVTGHRGEAISRALQDQLGRGADGGQAVRAGGFGRLDAAADRRSRATRTRTCSASSTRPPTCARTAGTSWAARCSTAGWRTRSRSTPCAGWSSTRTTCCG